MLNILEDDDKMKSSWLDESEKSEIKFKEIGPSKEYLRIIPKDETLDVVVADGIELTDAARKFIFAVNEMMTKPVITSTTPNGYDIILMCAFRYALGRKTYVVDYVTKAIHSYWPEMRESTKSIFVKEITEHQEKFGNLGHDIDKQQWLSIVDRYNSEKFTISNENGA